MVRRNNSCTVASERLPSRPIGIVHARQHGFPAKYRGLNNGPQAVPRGLLFAEPIDDDEVDLGAERRESESGDLLERAGIEPTSSGEGTAILGSFHAHARSEVFERHLTAVPAGGRSIRLHGARELVARTLEPVGELRQQCVRCRTASCLIPDSRNLHRIHP